MENLVPIQFDLWSSLLAFGIFQGILLLLILIGYKRNNATTFLIGMLLVLILNLFNHLILSTRLFISFPHLVYLFTPTLYLLGPLYYWYIKSITYREYTPDKVLLHLIPFFLAVVLMLPFTLLTGTDKVAVLTTQYQSNLIPMPISSLAFIAAQIIQSLIYIIHANKTLKQMSKNAPYRHMIKKIKWLQKFSLAFLIYWIIDLAALIIYSFKGTIHPEVFYLTTLCSAIFINFLVFYAIKNNKVFSQILLNNQGEKYRHTTLTKSESNYFLEKIGNYMNQEKPYLDPELTLSKLAQYLELSSNQVSQVLNIEMGKSFYEYINEYRFKEASHRLKQPNNKHLTILAIAFEAGFNNKNTFNKVFKKHAGITPSEYVKQNLSSTTN